MLHVTVSSADIVQSVAQLDAPRALGETLVIVRYHKALGHIQMTVNLLEGQEGCVDHLKARILIATSLKRPYSI